MGPVVGVVGALLADLALDWLNGDASRAGLMHSFDGQSVQLRTKRMPHRADCALCGSTSQKPIQILSRELYGAAPVGSATRQQPKLHHCN
jgi:hypothetical protein